MTEEHRVVLRRSEHNGFGFSLLGTTGPPHVIYDIIENSPAADCGAVEAGDVILKVNGTDVHRYTTKEVLKCLRLSDDLVTLELRRDPKLKARIKEQLARTRSPHYIDIESQNIYDYKAQISPTHSQTDSLNSSPSLRYKSTTNLPPRQTSATNHSRSSSTSSAKLQTSDGSAGAAAGGAAAATTSTSPSTCRPSRIPTAMKNPQKPVVAQHSPQYKRPRPSQIPTKAMAAAAAAASNGNSGSLSAAHLKHSRSYSGGGGGASGCDSVIVDSNFSSKSQTSRDIHHTKKSDDQLQQQHTSNSEPISAPPQPKRTPRFEAYMMTGDLILNLSRTPQSSNLIVEQAKKVDSLGDSPKRATVAMRANGAIAPRASGESSPTSSSSIESSLVNSESVDSANLARKTADKALGRKSQQSQHKIKQQTQQQRQQSNDENTLSNNSSDRQYRRDSLINDTLLLCDDLERDDDDELRNEEEDDGDEQQKDGYANNGSKRQRDISRQQQRHLRQQKSYEDFGDNEEDQTNYDITNIETYDYNSAAAGHCVDIGTASGDDQRHSDEEEDVGEDLSACVSVSSSNSLASVSAMQRLRELKQKQKQQLKIAATTSHAADSLGIPNADAAPPAFDLVDYARDTHKFPSQQQQSHLYQQQHHHFRHHHHQHHLTQHQQLSSSSSGGTVKSDGTSQDETSFSVPNSPISLSTPLLDKEMANSVPTSPEPSNILSGGAVGGVNAGSAYTADSVVRRQNGVVRKCDSAGFRTSKSEDHLQQIQREGIAAVIPIDIDEDVNSSLNTLLDTRHDSENSQASNRDRIVWTYNAPLTPQQLYQQQQQQQQNSYYSRSSPHSHSSSISSSSPHHSDSPASPTSVSSSVMSSSGSKGALGFIGSAAVSASGTTTPTAAIYQQQKTQQQQQLAHSNASTGIVLSDPSDSDSTILVSDAMHRRAKKSGSSPLEAHQQQLLHQKQTEHKLVIQVRGFDSASFNNNNSGSGSTTSRSAYADMKQTDNELTTLTEEENSSICATATTPTISPSMTNTTATMASVIGAASNNNENSRDSSPPVSDDGSDVESLHSYHYSPKAVDMPSAIRLAKRLYSLDGFKKSDVSRHLSKNNDFSRAVADEYLKYFNFEKKTLDQSLREFLQQFALSGETQERERVLVHFSKRFLDCNPDSFNSQDAVHTLTCAIMLLNTDLHGSNIGRKMSCAEFVDNLAELNDGDNFPKDVLKYLYQAIKSQPLEWALDEENANLQKARADMDIASSHIGQNPFLDIPESSAAVEYKKGYVMRKCCYEANYKKTPFGKRSWKMFYCTLRDLVLFLHKDEHGFRKSQMSDNLHNAIRIHHALATKAIDYTKKQHVFRLQTADQAEYLFQTSDSKELQSWVETINFVCAAYSAPPLEGGVGSQKRFQRPLLPSTHTKLLLREQLDSHEQQVTQLESNLTEHKKGPVPSKGQPLQNFKDKENYLHYELRRYKTYVSILSAKLLADQQLISDDESSDTFAIAENAAAAGGLIPLSAATRNAHVILASANSAMNQTQANSIIAGGQKQQQQQQSQLSSNRKKEKKKTF